jgi:hypothetical protein
LWPAAPLAAVAAPHVWQQHREPATQFLLAWIMPTWLLLELVPTKLPHYVLPLYPAIAILIARTMAQDGLSRNRHLVRANFLWLAVTVILPIVAVIAVIVLRRQLGLIAWPFSAAAMIFGFLAWRFYETDGAERSLLRGAVAAIMLSIGCPERFCRCCVRCFRAPCSPITFIPIASVRCLHRPAITSRASYSCSALRRA